MSADAIDNAAPIGRKSDVLPIESSEEGTDEFLPLDRQN